MTVSAPLPRYGYWRGTRTSTGPVLEPHQGLHATIVGTAGLAYLIDTTGGGDYDVRTYEFKLRVPTGRAEPIVLTFFDPHCPAYEAWPRYRSEMRRDSLVRVTVDPVDLPVLLSDEGQVVQPPELVLTAAEAEQFIAYIRPRIERGEGTWRMATAYLWAVKTRTPTGAGLSALGWHGMDGIPAQ